jgi:hypothetical protein
VDATVWEFIGDALLVLLGAGLTLGAGAVASFQRRREARDQRANEIADSRGEKDIAALESARQQAVIIHQTIRQAKGSDRNGNPVPGAMLDELDSRGYLLRDPILRETVRQAVNSIRSLGPAVDQGALDGPTASEQVRVSFSLVHVLSAAARGEDVPEKYRARIEQVSNLTDEVWADLMARDQAERA